jgi:hypothetical protein
VWYTPIIKTLTPHAGESWVWGHSHLHSKTLSQIWAGGGKPQCHIIKIIKYCKESWFKKKKN